MFTKEELFDDVNKLLLENNKKPITIKEFDMFIDRYRIGWEKSTLSSASILISCLIDAYDVGYSCAVEHINSSALQVLEQFNHITEEVPPKY